MRFVFILFNISIVFLNSCINQNSSQTDIKENEAVNVIEDFLEESIPRNKLKFIRPNSEYLRNHSIIDLIDELPAEYLEIRLSNEFVSDTEIIVEVVLDKILVGGKLVNKRQEFFVYKKDEEFKIDLDASFYRDTTIYKMWQKNIEFSKKLKVYVTGSLSQSRSIKNKKVLMELLDNQHQINIIVLNRDLANELKEILSKNNLAHLILNINFNQENEWKVIADSLIQVGWITNKN